VILNPGSRVSGHELLPVIGTQFAIPIPGDVRGVMVRSITGEAVICAPRCVPPSDLLAPPMTPIAAALCGEWLRHVPPLPAGRCRDVIYLDFGLLPQGKYTIEFVTDGGSIDLGAYLYSIDTPTPLAFIELLFSAPTAPASGVYPVRGLAADGEATIARVDYVLSFDARASFWNYYIVPQPDRYDYADLKIESVSPAPHVGFLGPCRVVLTNGAKAYRFMSDAMMGLRQQSPYRLRLRGTQGTHVLEEILMDPLPVASHRVAPWTDPGARLGLARSLPADAEPDSPCLALIGRVLGGADVPQADALALLRELRTVTQKARSPPPPSHERAPASLPGISDIYVYV
jgi:hypothetical protein